MVNKKILMSCLLILLVAISVSAVSAADDAAAVGAEDGKIIIVDGDDDVAVSTAMANATDGDTIMLGDTGYTFNNPITVDKELVFLGEGAIIYANGSQMPDGVFEVEATGAGTIFQGITFVNIDDEDNYLYKYNGMIDAKGKSVKTSVGIAIDLYSGADYVVIDDCTFQNWYNVGVSINSANYATVSNSQFYGGSATFINNIPDGPKDRGTYHISVMSSQGTTVDNCLFAGTVCDGVSVAGGSYDSTIINNMFQFNAFSIYFGGKSTEGTLIANNTFINCGWFTSDVYTADGTNGTVDFQDLPVISVQKSSDTFEIIDNTFYARNGNMLIKALEGSTAHGGASNIGNITITDNTVLPMDEYDPGFEKVVMGSVFLTYLETYNDVITPTGAIDIANNTLNGARAAVYWTQKWGDDLGDIHIVAAQVPTTIAITSLRDSTIKGALKDFNGKGIAGQTISFATDLFNGEVETEFDGSFIIEGVYDIVVLSFEDIDNYIGTTATVDVAPADVHDTFFAVNNIYADYDNVELVAVLVDGLTREVIAGANVTFVINGELYSATTDDAGMATAVPETLNPGDYSATVVYGGDENYNGCDEEFNVTVNKVTTILATQYDADTNELVATLINAQTGKGIKGANVVIKLNGAKNTVKTDASGQAKLSLGDVDPDDFTASFSYSGNAKYFKSTATIRGVENKTTTALALVYDKEAEEVVAVLTNSETGAAIKGATVVFTLNGEQVSVKTDANGQAIFSAADLRPDPYSISASYGGNGKYTKSTASFNFVKAHEDL
ncbi:right-handed parallel beta-helix repeat-containing protein [Methanobrevibacter sp.]|uniref:right-handed parallel beta-helix repeat-containing protein n=1 Tax=Methanobrevibacter sp. TaxID=66852 RepID=UPI0025E6DE68|nr:Ig-like domain repeat protein [Methanobrevibacter sp.]MBQ6511232.1 Ig-like domain repeat protein [Methanobrevibacter sp.]